MKLTKLILLATCLIFQIQMTSAIWLAPDQQELRGLLENKPLLMVSANDSPSFSPAPYPKK